MLLILIIEFFLYFRVDSVVALSIVTVKAEDSPYIH
jgi:hypothetical protein